MVASDWTMQFLADILNAPVERPKLLETTALGAAYLAGLHLDLVPSPDQQQSAWALDQRFTPHMAADHRAEKIAGWQSAVQRTLS